MHQVPNSARLQTIPTESGWVVELRPRGVARWLGAAFLSVWLCGWAAGEAVAIVALLAGAAALFAPGAIRWAPRWEAGPGLVFAGLFLVVWLTFWTIGGVAAIREFCSLLWGVDRVGIDGADLVLDSRAGPLRRTRRWPRDSVRRILVRRPDGAILVEAAGGTTPLSRFGDMWTRYELRERLRAALVLDATATERGAAGDTTLTPEGWDADVETDGSTRLAPARGTRAAQARTAWIVTAVLLAALLALVARAVDRGPDAATGLAVVAVLVVLVGAGAAWLSLGLAFFRVRRGAIERVVRFGGREWVRRFEAPRLAVDRRVDSDGDEHFSVVVRSEPGGPVLWSSMNERGRAVHLARWLADRAGAPLEIAPADDVPSEPPETRRGRSPWRAPP